MVKTKQIEQESYNINVTVDNSLYWKLREAALRKRQEFHQTVREILEEGANETKRN